MKGLASIISIIIEFIDLVISPHPHLHANKYNNDDEL